MPGGFERCSVPDRAPLINCLPFGAKAPQIVVDVTVHITAFTSYSWFTSHDDIRPDLGDYDVTCRVDHPFKWLIRREAEYWVCVK